MKSNKKQHEAFFVPFKSNIMNQIPRGIVMIIVIKFPSFQNIGVEPLKEIELRKPKMAPNHSKTCFPRVTVCPASCKLQGQANQTTFFCSSSSSSSSLNGSKAIFPFNSMFPNPQYTIPLSPTHVSCQEYKVFENRNVDSFHCPASEEKTAAVNVLPGIKGEFD